MPGSKLPIHISLESAPEASVVPEFASGGVVNYINGPDRSCWLEGLPLYRGIRYKSVADGIDLVFHGTQGRLEYDFDLAPRSDPSSAHLLIEDAAGLSLQADGSLLVTPVGGGSLRLNAPTAFQYRDGSRASVDVGFLVHDRTVGFRLGSYDPVLPLTIDPVVAYTALIDVNNTLTITGFGVDSSGNLIFAGSTFATNVPVVNGLQQNSSGSEQVYVTKLDSTGTNVVFCHLPIYLTQDSILHPASCSIPPAMSMSPVLPVIRHSPPLLKNLGTCSQACNNGFVFKLDTTGKVVYSTLIGSRAAGSKRSRGRFVRRAVCRRSHRRRRPQNRKRVRPRL